MRIIKSAVVEASRPFHLILATGISKMSFKVIKSYLEETTIHGFRYVGEAGSIAKRLTWSVLITISFTLAARLIAANLRDTSENPFVTSVTTVPVHEVPFPAVSVERSVVYPPWSTYSILMLNAANFDCLGKEDADCRRSDALLKHFGGLLRKRVELVFDKVYDEFKYYMSRFRPYMIEKICRRMEEIFAEQSEVEELMLQALADIMFSFKAKETFRRLATETFRQPKQSFAEAIKAELAYFATFTTPGNCSEVLSLEASTTVTASLAAWVFSQGSPEPALLFGDVIWADDLLPGMQTKSMAEETEALQKLNSALQILSPDDPELVRSMTDYLTLLKSEDFAISEVKEIAHWNCSLSSSNGLLLRCGGEPKSDHQPGCCALEKEVSKSYSRILRTMKYHFSGPWELEESGDVRDVGKGLRHLGMEARQESSLTRWWSVMQILSTTFYPVVRGSV